MTQRSPSSASSATPDDAQDRRHSIADSVLHQLRAREADSPEGTPACDVCRRRKVKCDRTLPVCGRCAKLGKRCLRSDTLRKRGPPTLEQKGILWALGLDVSTIRAKRRRAFNKDVGAQGSHPTSAAGAQSSHAPPEVATPGDGAALAMPELLREIPQTTLILDERGRLQAVRLDTFPRSVAEVVRQTPEDAAYLSLLGLDVDEDGKKQSQEAFVEAARVRATQIILHSTSRTLVADYLVNYHNRFPFVHEPSLWASLRKIEEAPPASHPLDQLGLLLMTVALATCTSPPLKTATGETANLWRRGLAAYRISRILLGSAPQTPELAQAYALGAGYALNEGGQTSWETIKAGWRVCQSTGFDRPQRIPGRDAIEQEKGIRVAWGLMKLAVTVALSSDADVDLTFFGTLNDARSELPAPHVDALNSETNAHTHPESLDTWVSAIVINHKFVRVRALSVGDDAEIARLRAEVDEWKRDAACLKLHAARALLPVGEQDHSERFVNARARVMLSRVEDELSQLAGAHSHANLGLDPPASGSATEPGPSPELASAGTGAGAGAGASGAAPAPDRAHRNTSEVEASQLQYAVLDRVAGWLRTVKTDGLLWYTPRRRANSPGSDHEDGDSGNGRLEGLGPTGSGAG
ncbi:unnamed protein product [Parajaminaea phylloscopi]